MKIKTKQKSDYIFELIVGIIFFIFTAHNIIIGKNMGFMSVILFIGGIGFFIVAYFRYNKKFSENIIDVENYEVIEEPIEKENLDEYKNINVAGEGTKGEVIQNDI